MFASSMGLSSGGVSEICSFGGSLEAAAPLLEGFGALLLPFFGDLEAELEGGGCDGRVL